MNINIIKMQNELMNSLTNDQLLLCEKEDLVEYINGLKEGSVRVKYYNEGAPFVDKFLNELCVLKDDVAQVNGYTIAPSSFEDLYYEYKSFCEDNGLKSGVKKQVKKLMLESQEKSKYGLDLGKHIKDGKKNGTLFRPYFNFVYEED
jgi:hypothetical protein